MVRGRRPGRTSSTAVGVGRAGRKTPLENSRLTTTSARRVSPATAAAAANDGGLFADGGGRGNWGRPAASKSTTQKQQQRHQQQQGGILRLQPSNPTVSFWKGFCRPDALVQALANIGTMIEAESPPLVTSSQPPYPFSGLSMDRLLVAIHAIVNAVALMESCDNSEDNDSSPEERSQTWGNIQNLVRLAENAVPMKLSALIGSSLVDDVGDMTSTTTNTSASASTISPTTLWTLLDRLRRLKRLWQLQEVHTRILPSLRDCNSKSDVVALLFGFTRDKGNTIEFMPEMTSLPNHEQQVLHALMEEVNNNNLCMELRSTLSFPLLRVSSGSYIIHRRSRLAVLRYLLNVAEFFGLPPCLRYIRVSARRTQPCLKDPRMTYMPLTSSNIESYLDVSPSSPPLLFPSPCDINLCGYGVPKFSDIHSVQEELIGLANNYFCFGILVGEADQILLLLRASAVWQERMNAGHERSVGAGTGEVVKLEQSDENSLPDAGKDKVKSDPLLSYAQLFLPTPSEGNTKRIGAHWICDNRWSCSMRYYALVLAVMEPRNEVCENVEVEEVAELGEQKGCEEEETKDGEKSLRRYASITSLYYVAAVLELVRS